MIESQHEPDLNLTVFVCSGRPTSEAVAETLKAFYAGSPTLNTIWDYTAADLSALTGEKISQLAVFLKNNAHSRAGGRAALVFTVDQIMSIQDRLERLTELELPDATIKIFNELAQARAWVAG
jgi:hypothetical protein